MFYKVYSSAAKTRKVQLVLEASLRAASPIRKFGFSGETSIVYRSLFSAVLTAVISTQSYAETLNKNCIPKGPHIDNNLLIYHNQKNPSEVNYSFIYINHPNYCIKSEGSEKSLPNKYCTTFFVDSNNCISIGKTSDVVAHDSLPFCAIPREGETLSRRGTTLLSKLCSSSIYNFHPICYEYKYFSKYYTKYCLNASRETISFSILRKREEGMFEFNTKGSAQRVTVYSEYLIYNLKEKEILIVDRPGKNFFPPRYEP